MPVKDIKLRPMLGFHTYLDKNMFHPQFCENVCQRQIIGAETAITYFPILAVSELVNRTFGIRNDRFS